MASVELTRRTLLASFGACAIAASVWSLAQQSGLSTQERQRLLRMARHLYPHNNLSDDVYAECLTWIYESANVDPVLSQLLRDGLDALDAAANGNWLVASPDDQVRALRNVESSDFFEAVKDEARTALYEHPAVWALIGYEGSSVEYGGYIDRGFDDIDWLPDDFA